MRIDNQVRNELSNRSIAGSENTRNENLQNQKPGDISKSVEVISQQESKIQAALNSADVNVSQVEAAKKALADGSLDTPEAARKAAENIIDFGL